MKSTMQTSGLGVARLLRAAARFGASCPVHAWNGHGIVTTDMQATAIQALKLGAALHGLGLRPGDRVATLCAATREHCEAYLGIPSRGLVLHALNIRMSDEDLCRMLHECGDRVLILDPGLWDRFRDLAPALRDSRLELVLLTGDAPLPDTNGLDLPVRSYRAVLDSMPAPDAAALADPPEDSAAAICHTGGTTGRPKAVAYSHRSIWLQAISLCLADSLALGRSDVALLAVPLYHVNGWGLPYAAVMSGAGLALPGETFRPAILREMMQACGVTIAAGVPTIWTDFLAHLDAEEEPIPPSLNRVATGGAVVPASLIDRLERAGVNVLQAWGMTETSAMSVVGRATAAESGTPAPLGYPSPTVELRIAPPQEAAPGQNPSQGEIQIRGVCVTGHYLGTDTAATDAGGWLSTGDIGTLRGDGALVLLDRLKDAIKSGGEWIPAPALEDAIRAIDWVEDVAVIAQPHARFQERPLGIVVLKAGADFDRGQMETALRARVPSWWLPDGWCLLDSLPRTTLGKPDKMVLRAMLADGRLAESTATVPPTPNRTARHKGDRHERG